MRSRSWPFSPSVSSAAPAHRPRRRVSLPPSRSTKARARWPATASGINNNGSVVGATWSATGKFGKALSFSATRQSYVSVPDSASLHLTAHDARGVGAAELAVGQLAYGHLEGTARWHGVRPLREQRCRSTGGQVYTATEQNAPGTAQLPLNAWTHLAATFGGGVLKLFVNGVAGRRASPFPGAVIASNGSLKIGGNAIWGEWFNGLIDEVRRLQPCADGGRDPDRHEHAGAVGHRGAHCSRQPHRDRQNTDVRLALVDGVDGQCRRRRVRPVPKRRARRHVSDDGRDRDRPGVRYDVHPRGRRLRPGGKPFGPVLDHRRHDGMRHRTAHRADHRRRMEAARFRGT